MTDAGSSGPVDLTGRDRIPVVKDGEEIDVFNHVSVSTHHYINSINGYESFEPDVAKGDMGRGPQPEAVTPRVASLLRDLGVDAESLGIEVIDPNSGGVEIL